jgi:hypothetical protein
VFGRRHLGRIHGAAQALTVLASAVEPLRLAWWVELTGSYATMFRALAAVGFAGGPRRLLGAGVLAVLVRAWRPVTRRESGASIRGA